MKKVIVCAGSLLISAVLLSQVPAPSPSGVTRYAGHGAPTVLTGSAYGDEYIDMDTGDVYRCLSLSGPCRAVLSTGWVRGVMQSDADLKAPIASPTFTGTVTIPLAATTTNCSSSASPAVCAAAPAGSAVVAASATSVVVNTTAVTANSQILVTADSSLGTKLSVTCNTQALTTLGAPRVTARTAATSFTVSIDVGPTTNPLCFSYLIVN